MDSKQYFALALRIIGVVVSGRGVMDIVEWFLGTLGYFTTQRTAYSYFLIIGLGYLVAGLYLVRGAALVVRFAYPESPDDETDEVAQESETQAAETERE